MGYSHHARVRKKHYEQALQAIPLVSRDLKRLHEAKVFPPLAGPLGTGEPEFDDGAIAFNGVKPDDYETFYIGPTDPFPGETHRSYITKTCHRPYDLAVKVALALWWWHSGKVIEVDSDGEVGEWEGVLELIEVEFGYIIEANELFEISYAYVGFPRGLRVVVELRHHQPDHFGRDTIRWLKGVLSYLRRNEYNQASELGSDVLSALLQEDLEGASVIMRTENPLAGFSGRRRYGAIIFPDEPLLLGAA